MESIDHNQPNAAVPQQPAPAPAAQPDGVPTPKAGDTPNAVNPYTVNPYVAQQQAAGGYPPYAGPTNVPNAAGYPPYATAPYTPTAPAQPKEKFQLNKEDLIFAIAAAVLTLFGVAAGIWGGFRLGYTAAFLLIFALLTVYLLRKKRRPTLFGAVCGVLSVALAPVFALTSNEIVRFLCIPAGAGLAMLWFLSLAGRKLPAGDTGLLAAWVRALTDAPGNLPQTLGGLFISEKGGMKKTSRVLLGVLCAVPVLCAVIPLLIHSDAAFEGMVKSFFADLGTVAAQVLLAAALTPLILSFAFSLRKKDVPERDVRMGKRLPTEFTAAFFGLLSLVYVFYLGSQLAYFFDAFRGLLPEGYDFSYAEYARRGFFELCAVAGINLVLLYIAILFSRKADGKLPGALKGLGTFIVLFTLVLIGTALAKMKLYIDTYGMTVLRLGTSVFMAFMAVVFLAVLARLFTAKAKILHTAVLAAAVALLALGIGNVNQITASYNYNAYVSGKLPAIDAPYLATLGPESAPYLAKLMRDETQPDTVRRSAAYGLFNNIAIGLYKNEYMYNAYRSPFKDHSYFEYWDGFVFTKPLEKTSTKPSQVSLPQQRAYAAIEDLLKAYPDYLEKEAFYAAIYSGDWAYTDDPATEPALLYPSIEDFWEAQEVIEKASEAAIPAE